MVTIEEIRQREAELERVKQQARRASGERVPQRRFGSGVTREQQQAVLQRRQQARETISNIEKQQRELKSVRGELGRARKERERQERIRNVVRSALTTGSVGSGFQRLSKEDRATATELIKEAEDVGERKAIALATFDIESNLQQSLTQDVRDRIARQAVQGKTRITISERDLPPGAVGSGISGGLLFEDPSAPGGVREFIPIQQTTTGGIVFQAVETITPTQREELEGRSLPIGEREVPVTPERQRGIVTRVLTAPIESFDEAVEREAQKTESFIDAVGDLASRATGRDIEVGLTVNPRLTRINPTLEKIPIPFRETPLQVPDKVLTSKQIGDLVRIGGAVAPFTTVPTTVIATIGITAGEIDKIQNEPLTTQEKITSATTAVISTAVGASALKRPAVRFLTQPTVKLGAVPATQFTSKEIIKQLTPDTAVARFELTATTPGRTATVTRRLDKAFKIEPQIINVTQPKTTIVRTGDILIKGGEVVVPVKTITATQRGSLKVGKLSGRFGEEINLQRISKLPKSAQRQIQALAEAKVGRPVPLKFAPQILGKRFADLSVQRGEVLTKDLIKIGRTPQPLIKLPKLPKELATIGFTLAPGAIKKGRPITPIPRGRTVRRAELTAIIEEAKLPKGLAKQLERQNIEVFKSLTAVGDVTKPLAPRRRKLPKIFEELGVKTEDIIDPIPSKFPRSQIVRRSFEFEALPAKERRSLRKKGVLGFFQRELAFGDPVKLKGRRLVGRSKIETTLKEGDIFVDANLLPERVSRSVFLHEIGHRIDFRTFEKSISKRVEDTLGGGIGSLGRLRESVKVSQARRKARKFVRERGIQVPPGKEFSEFFAEKLSDRKVFTQLVKGIENPLIEPTRRGKIPVIRGTTIIKTPKFDTDIVTGSIRAKPKLKTQSVQDVLKPLRQLQAGAVLSVPKPRTPPVRTITSRVSEKQPKISESTKGVTALKTVQVAQPKTATKELTRQQPGQLTRITQRALPRTVVKLTAKTAPRALTRQVPRLVPRETTRQVPRLIPRTVPRLVPRQVTKTPPPPRIPPVFRPQPRPKPNKIPIPIGFKFPTQKVPKSSPGFRTFVIRKGKRVFLTGVRPRGRALEIGARTTKGTLSATFGVLRTKQRVRQRDVDFRPSTKVFRQFRIRKGEKVPLQNLFIQRTTLEGGLPGGRLAFPGETREISSARRNSFKVPQIKLPKIRI